MSNPKTHGNPPRTLLGPTGKPIRRDAGTLTEKMIERAFREAQRGSEPRKVGKVGDPGHFYPDLRIEPQPFKWDTNSFYRRLGLDPECERADIARVVSTLDPSKITTDEYRYLMVAARILLKKRLRQTYDRIRLGAFWTDDPDLMQGVRDQDLDLRPQSEDEWAVYADSSVSDEEALSIDPLWRSMIAIELARRLTHLPEIPPVGIGASATQREQPWAQVGYFPVCFLKVDSRANEEYAAHAAQLLVEIAQPVTMTRY